MTQVFNEQGNVVPVTVLDASGCHITQIRTKERDGYSALQLGIGSRKPQNLSRPSAGHLRKAGVASKAISREFRLVDQVDASTFKSGQALSVEMFAKGDRVDVIGFSKGKGFQGVMRRHNFSGKDATHGTSKYFRHGGSNGSNTFPGRVLRNKGMPGHMGDARVTVMNIEVADVRPKDHLLLLKGAVCGPNGSVVTIRTSQRCSKAPENRPWCVN
jgi:large subunit ribosomal protein L3